MKRKTFINRLSLGSGAAMLLPSFSLLQSCEYKPTVRTVLTDADIPLLNEIAETILPTTESVGGAKAADVASYMVTMYDDCLDPGEQTIFLGGINEIDARSAKIYKNRFSNLEPAQKLDLMKTIQAEAIDYNLKLEETKDDLVRNPVSEEYYEREPENHQKPLPHYFDLLKGLTVSGYFTSKIGMTEAREYLPVPGNYEACIPYVEGDRPWAT